MHGQSQLVSYGIAVVVIILVLALRWRRMGRDRPLRLERLWMLPAIYGAFAVLLVAETPPDAVGWLWCLGALIVGGAIGWFRGRFVTVTVDPETHALNQKASPAGFIFIIALVAVRFGLRSVLATEASTWHIGAAVIVDTFIALALGLIALQRLEIYLRASRLLAEARAVRGCS